METVWKSPGAMWSSAGPGGRASCQSRDGQSVEGLVICDPSLSMAYQP